MDDEMLEVAFLCTGVCVSWSCTDALLCFGAAENSSIRVHFPSMEIV